MNNQKIKSIIVGLLVVILAGATVVFGSPKKTVFAPALPPPVSAPTVAQTSISSYTLADVSAHDTPTDCWTAISGSVYDLTEWIARHPGGESAIISICGTDSTAAFVAQHGGQSRPEAALATFKIGTLK